jgi:large subunit ribosomal protein L11|tara:strand:- start:2675 stop:3352 length:678 start_codon:yes stop_codon:yes gene_type:complete
MTTIKLIVDGGSMKPGPTVAQQLGPMGINLGKLIEDTNKATSGFSGMKVPIIIEVNPKTKEYSISVSSPPVSELIKKELGIDKGSAQSGNVYTGNLAIEQAILVAKTKMPDMLARDLKAATKLVVGSCVSLGVFVESKKPQEINQEIDSGVFSSEISSEKTEVSPEKKAELDKFFKEIESQQEAKAKAEAVAKEEAEAAKAEAAPTEEAKEGEKKEETKEEPKKK